MKFFYIYVMRWNNSGNLYIGYTKDLIRRMTEHTKEAPCTLLYYEAYNSEKLARTREGKLKQYGSAWKGLKKRIVA